eukprot:CAMPEP_0206168822 /NCGR_PEP_ID=MMETSP1474-20131121/33592_1 /ASSEMBLY_ACC=CAM_ASM_001110 /TAXON_ID=97495 /ORGANISM="Imantonia sp., Strain RCC918" /LENGTH=293 /DNA_ID=CAMNT_0053574447 /DNA_START=759 /DNA_END=1636 /DNA_ORIENTATION=-
MRHIVHKLTTLALKIDYDLLQRSGLVHKLAQKQRELKDAQDAFAVLKMELNRCKDHYNHKKNEMNRQKQRANQIAPMTAELKELFKTFPDDIDKLNIAIEEAEIKANLNYRENPHLIEDYEKRSAEIAELQTQLNDMTENADTIDQKMENTKQQWLPNLKILVGKINNSFKKYFHNIGCYGRVNLAEDNDFSKYGIVIHVSFRTGQKAQILDAHTQSGGERSVTTMLFLVSLQDLTKCPFRLVDEINQGMDPTNERMIFEEVSKSACKPNQPQFFLITPKLLPGLVFTKEMTV